MSRGFIGHYMEPNFFWRVSVYICNMYTHYTHCMLCCLQFPKAIPAAAAANVAASCAFSEYVRCASKIRSPCWQILSSGWQITLVFDEAAPVTASPKSGTALDNCLSDGRRRRDGLPGSPKITTELTCAIVLAGSNFAALWTSWPPCEYPLMTSLVFGHEFSVLVTSDALRNGQPLFNQDRLKGITSFDYPQHLRSLKTPRY
jgi:hypothetical protein